MDFSLTSFSGILVLVLILLITVQVVVAMGLFGGNKMPVEGKTVLITGGSEGMGLSVSKQLAAKGANVCIVSRSVSKLEVAIKEIQAAAKDPLKQRFHFISADVATPNYAAAVVEEVKQWNNGETPHVVWNVAGFSRPELFLDMEMSSMRRQMDVNFFGTAEMSHAILREWLAPEMPVEEQPRHLIMTTSVAAACPIPGYGPYTPGKIALRGLAETLVREVELYPQNVKVHLVWPGGIKSAGYEEEQKTKPLITKQIEEMDPIMDPDVVASKAIAGLENGQFYTTVHWTGNFALAAALGSAPRHSWILDTMKAWAGSLAYMFVLPDFDSQVRKHKKEHGHPSSLAKE